MNMYYNKMWGSPHKGIIPIGFQPILKLVRVSKDAYYNNQNPITPNQSIKQKQKTLRTVPNFLVP